MPERDAVAKLGEDYASRRVRGRQRRAVPARQAEATGVVPDDRTIVVERFRDEIGDWRVCVLSPFGTPVHAPWAMAIERRLIDKYDLPVETMWGDDGIVIRLPEAADELDVDVFMIDPEDIDELVVSSLPQTSLFSARFRECAAARCCCRRWPRPDKRTPLWQQRQKAADLLAVASKYPTFPILLETSPRMPPRRVRRAGIARGARSAAIAAAPARPGRHRVVEPMASSLLFNWIAQYMYEGDAPLAERRAAVLALDRATSSASCSSGGTPRAPRPGRARRRRARTAVPRRRSSCTNPRRTP